MGLGGKHGTGNVTRSYKTKENDKIFIRNSPGEGGRWTISYKVIKSKGIRNEQALKQKSRQG